MKTFILAIVTLLAGMHTQAQGAPAKPLTPRATSKTSTRPDNKVETPHLEFVTEYVRELAAIEGIRESGETELKADPQSIFMNSIHTGTLMQLELRTQIGQLKRMRLDEPFSDLIPTITEFYKDKIELWQEMIDIASAFVGDPKQNVDYAKLTADLPKIRARLDYIDKALFEASPLVFTTLVSVKPDSKGRTSHLIITKAERADLIEQIDTDFGSKLDAQRPNYVVAAALILRDGLQKDYKSSDDPWD
jgi:hypothetical protein